MSDAAGSFMDHARAAARKARGMERGTWRDRQRRVARVYHLLAKQAEEGAKFARVVDFRRRRSG